MPSASRRRRVHFFSKNAKDLNLLESATLAGLVKNPVGYDPIDNPERSESRRNVVLDRMAQLGVLTEKKAERLKAIPLKKTLEVKASPNGCQQSQAPFFCDYVVNWLLKDPVLGDTPKERRRTLNNGGLTIRTTIDLDMQKAADTSVASHVYPTDQAIGGLAMVEPGTGDVRALAQSRPMGKDKEAGQTYLNYVVPKEYGDANGFQAGLDLQGLRPRRGHQPGHPAEHHHQRPGGDEHPRRGVRELRRPLRR